MLNRFLKRGSAVGYAVKNLESAAISGKCFIISIRSSEGIAWKLEPMNTLKCVVNFPFWKTCVSPGIPSFTGSMVFDVKDSFFTGLV